MKYLFMVIITIMTGFMSAHAELHTEIVEYTHGDVLLEGYLTYDDAVKGKRPGVLVVQEWWGLNDYIKKRADKLAKLGYIAFAIDMYGKGIRTKESQRAGELANIYLKDRQLMRARVNAGLEILKKNNLTDNKRLAAIGYCFGGTTVLELARSGADVAGVVSFHGGLTTLNPADTKSIKAKVLVLHGADDPFISKEQISDFQDEMRKAGADWQMVFYGGAEHSFTNPEADGYGIKGVAYNGKADKRSWETMRSFFLEIFK